MIERISKLKNFGKFSSFHQDKEFKYGEGNQNCNIVFGFNGSGKTTLANAISLFADNSFISEEEKRESFSDIQVGDDSAVELSLQDRYTIKYPASKPHSKNFYVFNSNFVSTHVFNGTKGKLKKFSNIGGEIKNNEIDSINQRIDALEEEKKSLTSENEKFNQENKDITRKRSKDFGRTLTDSNKKLHPKNLSECQLPSRTIEELETVLSSLSAEYELSKRQDDLNDDLSELRQLSFARLTCDFRSIDKILTQNIQQLSKDAIETKITEIKNLFLDEEHKRKVEPWLRYGKDVLEQMTEHERTNCPICNTDISDRLDSLLQDYQKYFDESYTEFISELSTKATEVSAIIDSLGQFEIDSEKLSKIFTTYKGLLNQNSFEGFDFSEIKRDFAELQKSLTAKKDDIQSTPSKPSSIGDNFTKLNEAITRLSNLTASILSVLEQMSLDTHQLENKIRQTYHEIIVLEFNDTDKAGAFGRYKNNEARLSTILGSGSECLPFLRSKLREELGKLKAESRSISKYLIKMGIDHFDVDINENQQDENIIIKYNNSPNDRNNLKNSLSDGEKTALAFAYFLSKFENEINTPQKAVVIIDDPVSSLDENRLYSTASLISHNFEKVKQLIVLSHNFLFLKFFNSFYYGRTNCLFLDGEKVTELPDELKNFETPYFYMLKSIGDFMNDRVGYNEAKRYLPNFIRRVLETFLSFKFSSLASRSRDYRSPGLNEFNRDIDNTVMEDNIKSDLKDKIAEINRIANTHSHGNAHHTQENFYISEAELKTLARNAIYVIETMDSVNTSSFVSEA